MKDKKIRILCAVTALVSVLAVIPIMFEFMEIDYGRYAYNIWGFYIYLEAPIYIVVGSLGLIALLWDLVYGAYAMIDGRYRNLTWRIARYGYFYGIVAALVNFSFILSYIISYSGSPCAFSIIFLVLIAATVILKFFLIFSKDEQTKTANI